MSLNKIIIGNWKMNTTIEEGIQLIQSIHNQLSSSQTKIVICPPHTHLASFKSLNLTSISLGAQNCSDRDSGAFTGDISVSMIKGLADYCIIGHSERRNYHYETNQMLKSKIDLLLDNNISPVFCCGESKEERDAQKHFERVKTQIYETLFHLSEDKISKIIIAYEPVWAIGTGKNATTEQAEEMHLFIREQITKKYSQEIAASISLIYGGSCNASNAKEIFAQTNIDGGLIGGASLKTDEFIQIINSI